jgi:hypothetical protein
LTSGKPRKSKKGLFPMRHVLRSVCSAILLSAVSGTAAIAADYPPPKQGGFIVHPGVHRNARPRHDGEREVLQGAAGAVAEIGAGTRNVRFSAPHQFKLRCQTLII